VTVKSVHDVVTGITYEIAALVAVLEHKGILTQQEVLDEITRLKAKTPAAR